MPANPTNFERSEHYLELFAEDQAMRLSLLACAAALSLDDGTASEAIGAVLSERAAIPELVKRIKGLGCVWRKWDGSWRISDDVRAGFSDLLRKELPPDRIIDLRSRLAWRAEERANSLSPDGQITNYRVREARFEAAYQQWLVPDRSQEGAELFADIWRKSPPDAQAATANAVDYVVEEVTAKHLPAELLFLKGLAARSRGDKRHAEEYFRQVWEQGRPGDIFAIAAHLFGNLASDERVAERALRNSIEWYPNAVHRGQVWHSLGNLLSRDPSRWTEAEKAYHTSIQLLPNDAVRAPSWHSLGNLLSRQPRRLNDAEEAFKKSLRVRHDPYHQGQVWHSLANLISRQRSRTKESEDAYRKSLQLLREPDDQAQVWHSLANLLKKQTSRSEEAENAYRNGLRLVRQASSEGQIWHSLGNFLASQEGRWEEAQAAYEHGLRTANAYSRTQIYASWAGAILKYRESSEYEKVEDFAARALSLRPRDPRTRSTVHGLLAKLYELTGRYSRAISALTIAIEADRELKNWQFVKKREAQRDQLRQKAKD